MLLEDRSWVGGECVCGGRVVLVVVVEEGREGERCGTAPRVVTECLLTSLLLLFHWCHPHHSTGAQEPLRDPAQGL